MRKRMIATLLALCMALTLLPTSALAVELREGRTDLDGPETDEVSAPGDGKPVHILNGLGDKVELSYPTVLRPGVRLPRTSQTLPARYISEAAMEIPVRDQGGYGLCWAFCTYGALETWMNQHGMGTSYDFSELHMGYATSSSGGNDLKGFVSEDGDPRPDPDSGGGRSHASAYLMRGPDLNGAVNEADDPYPDIDDTYDNDMPVRDVSITSGIRPSYTVSNILYVTGNPTSSKGQEEAIKSHIISQGGVGSTIWSEMDDESPYYNDENKAYFYNGDEIESTNHLVEIVGWDDAYSKTNFVSGNQPENDGAWLVKNSWGTDWGEDGYFWVSYEDKNFPGWVYCFDGDVNPYDSSVFVYETDYTLTDYYWGWTIEDMGSDTEAYFAKVYETQTANESLTSVRFHLNGPKTVQLGTVAVEDDGTLAVGADVFKPLNVTTSAASGDVRIDGTSVEFDYPGWYTLDIMDGPTYEAAGIRFAVVVKVTEHPIYAADDSLYRISYDNGREAPAGTAYLTRNTSSWSEKSEANFCIKAVTTASTATTDPSPSFTDLASGAWYQDAVKYAVQNNLMSGYEDGTFGPNNSLTRAQLAQILYNKEDKPAVSGGSAFTDVPNGQWYTPAVVWATAAGVVGGYGNGRFGPDDNITREQLAVMLWRYDGAPDAGSGTLDFIDAGQSSPWAVEALKWAISRGVLSGRGGGVLDPTGLATRAEAAQMLKNFMTIQ